MSIQIFLPGDPPPALENSAGQGERAGRGTSRIDCAVGRAVLSLEWANDVEGAERSQDKGKFQTCWRVGRPGKRDGESIAVGLS
jgi:hypothetical protein